MDASVRSVVRASLPVTACSSTHCDAANVSLLCRYILHVHAVAGLSLKASALQLHAISRTSVSLLTPSAVPFLFSFCHVGTFAGRREKQPTPFVRSFRTSPILITFVLKALSSRKRAWRRERQCFVSGATPTPLRPFGV